MSQKIKQNVSAFVDNDKSVADVVDKLKQDKDLEETFGRYNLIGDVMRNEVPDHLHLDLADSIADAIEKEPVVLAPNSEFAAAMSEQENENKVTESTSTKGKVISFFRPVMQYGIAASFAAALVVGFQAEQVEAPDAGFEPVIHTMPLASGLDPVSAEKSRTVIDPMVIQEQRRRVNSYIQDHSQQLKNRQYASFELEQETKQDETDSEQ